MRIESKKINSLTEMLTIFFWDNDKVMKATLERKVEADTIAIAITEHFIRLEHTFDGISLYCITPKGKEYIK